MLHPSDASPPGYDAALLDTLFGSASVALVFIDRDLRFRRISDALAEINGLPAPAHLGRTVEEVVPRLAPTLVPLIRRTLETGEPITSIEIAGETPRAPGQQRQFLVSHYPVRDARGEILGVSAIVTEVTLQRQAEAALRAKNEEALTTLERITDAFFAVDTQWRFTYLNPAAERLTGRDRSELLGRRLWEEFPALVVSPFYRQYHRAMAEQVTVAFEEFYPRRGRWFEGRAYPSGAGLSVYLRDVTEKKRVETALLESEARFRSAFEDAAIGMALVSPDGRWLRVNPALCQMLGYTGEELLSGAYTYLDITHPEDVPRDQELIRAHLAGEASAAHTEKRYVRKDGHPVWARLSISLVRDGEGRPLCFVKQIEDISERKEAEARVFWQAHHDALTGLPNRFLFQDRVERAVAHAQRHDQRVAVLFLDLDGFKHVNDTLGHAVGDRLLRAVAERLAPVLRAEDTLARMGGDEFTVLVPGLTHAEDAALIAWRLLEALRAPLAVDGHDLVVSASVGVSVFPPDGADTDTLLRNADLAMYRAKADGKNGYRLFAEAMTAAATERLALESGLRGATQRDEMALFYQPLVSLDGGGIVGAEALLRWNHRDRGMVPPARFIPVAEETGLIVPVGAWVLRETCLQAARWQAQGRPMRVSVNLSARQLRSAGLVESVAAALGEAGLAPQWLQLELTESALMDDPDAAAQTLGALRAMGVYLSVDDFGTGYSSLARLRRFALDGLKVDRAFVAGLTEAVEDRAVVRALVELGRTLKMTVVAEGVETEAQREMLREIGCDAFQGYLFSPPVPVPELEALLLRQHPSDRG